MTAILFDTLRFSQTLRDKGHFTSEQAEALVAAFAEASQDNIATKLDIADVKTEIGSLRADVGAQIETLRADVGAQIAESKAEIIKWMFGTIGFQTIVILGAVIALARIMGR